MFNFGLENLEGIDLQETMSFEACVLASTEASLEALSAMNEMDCELAQLDAMEDAFTNLVAVKDVISTEGVSASLVTLVGKSLEKVAPSLIGGGDSETVVSELETSEEGFAAKIIQTIKNIIAKVLAFFKRLFSSQDKMAGALKDMTKDVDTSKVDWKDVKEKSVLGLEFSKFKALFGSGLAPLDKALGALQDAYFAEKPAAECIAGFNSIAKTAVGLELDEKLKLKVADASFYAFEKKSLEKLMFTSVADVMSFADKAGAITDAASKKLESQVKKAEEYTTKKAKELDGSEKGGAVADKVKLAWPPAKFAGTVAAISTKLNGMTFKLLQQQTAMAKIVVAAAKGGKSDSKDKKDDDK